MLSFHLHAMWGWDWLRSGFKVAQVMPNHSLGHHSLKLQVLPLLYASAKILFVLTNVLQLIWYHRPGKEPS